MVYVRDGHVSGLEFDAERRIVAGRVKGSHHASYATSVQLAGGVNGTPHAHLLVHRGRCSCPVAVDCKHAAAVLVAARSLPVITTQLNRPDWERSLGRLAAANDAVRDPDVVELGLEFDLEQTAGYRDAPGSLALRARPVRRGSSGRWVRSGVGWEQLDYLASGRRSDQRDLLLQLWASAGAPARFAYPRGPWLVLTGIGPSVWSVLGRAAGAGLELVAAAGTDDLVVEWRDVQVGLDVREQADGALELTPVVLMDHSPLVTGRIGTLGEPAHGLFWLTVPATAKRRPGLVLAPLSTPLGSELRTLVNRRSQVRVPAPDRGRFLEEMLPTLRPAVRLVSGDGTVDLPEPVRPRLVCTVGYLPEHRLRLDWAFAYGDQAYDLDAPVVPPTVRDRHAERELTGALELPYLRMPALRAPQGSGPAAHALLAARDTAIFATEVLPSLAEAGVEVHTTGEPIDYRATAAVPQIEVSTQERTGSPEGRVGGADWFDLHVTVRVDGEPVDFEQLFVALTIGDEFLITPDGVCIALDRPELAMLRDLIAEARSLRDHGDGPGLRINPAQVSLWDELVELGVVVGESARWARAVRGLLGSDEDPPPEVPRTIQAELRPYQLEGYQWLVARYRHDVGGILADDMGLGKTLQTLALIAFAREQHPEDPPFLVVAPTSVTSNWVHEARRFAPHLRVVALDGGATRRRRTLTESSADDVVVASYAVARLDVGQLAGRSWRGVILDEAQFVKNHRSKTYQSIRHLEAPFRLAITGTPLENDLMDLWSLLSITAPGLFPHPQHFGEHYRLPIERDGDQTVLERLRRRVRPLLLRRTKANVAADLPPKQEQVVDVPLAPRHLRVYQTHLQRERQRVLGLVDELDRNRFTILRSITLLRQLALDPALVDLKYEGVPASKVELLVEQLTELVAEGHRALVFSQFTGFLERIRTRLVAAGLVVSYLDGRTKDRDAAIGTFTGGAASTFLISLKAGGFGLNLTHADYCFVLDPWWNPATEAQAVDRAHRIGQTRPVMVYRLVARGTIEEKVMALKARKERLIGSVLTDDVLSDSSLSADEIRELLAG
jgi:superfamily II DNA or RNA helicase